MRAGETAIYDREPEASDRTDRRLAADPVATMTTRLRKHRGAIIPAERVIRAFVVLAIAGIPAACASKPGPEVLQLAVDEARGVTVVDTYVATTRQSLADSAAGYGRDRARHTSYARYAISIPPGHRPGRIEWPKGKPDAANSFAVTDRRPLSRSDFFDEVTTHSEAGRRHVSVFVHGYNQNFQEALFRLAQMTADGGFAGSSILFTWPSQAELEGYVADRDSVMHSRDGLVALLTTLGQSSNVGDITILSHSMGGLLTMEALRQLRLTGRDDVLDRLHAVLVSPDIDVDVFRAQADVVGRMDPPISVLVSTDDRALQLSQRVGGGRRRLGLLSATDPDALKIARETNVTLVDISSVETTDRLRHARYADLATLFGSLSSTEQESMIQGLRHAGAYVFNAVGATLSRPSSVVGEALAAE